MSEIDDILNRILKAVHGKDVRQSIHDGVKMAYDTASGIDIKASTALTTANKAFKAASEAASSVDNKVDKDFGGSVSKSMIPEYQTTKGGLYIGGLEVTKYTDETQTIDGITATPRKDTQIASWGYIKSRLAYKLDYDGKNVPLGEWHLAGSFRSPNGSVTGNALPIVARTEVVDGVTKATISVGLDPENDGDVVNYKFFKSHANALFEYIPGDGVFRDVLNHDIQYSMDDVIDMCDFGLGNTAFPTILVGSRVYRCEQIHVWQFPDERRISSLDFMSTEQQGPIGYVHTMTISRDAEAPIFKSYMHTLDPY